MPTEREKILVGFGQAFEHGRFGDRALFSVKLSKQDDGKYETRY